jgi:dimeric dUTPase (all-alpha-NTP-PPase superfamily)
MWENMMATQEILDQRIIQEKGLKIEDLQEERILALLDEVMEYAKETKCFKYWSEKDPAPDQVRLEEFVDGLHFYLSFFNTFNISADEVRSHADHFKNMGRVIDKKVRITTHIFRATNYGLYIADSLNINEMEQKVHLMMSFAHFMAAGKADGFTLDRIEKAYYIKNQTNHKRQDDHY